ncbi:MAG: DUF2807 domain-containing protein [Bacteroidetes bacterium]|nr:DUF2807 domain-containing protein [Bacteroidota bacterium]
MKNVKTILNQLIFLSLLQLLNPYSKCLGQSVKGNGNIIKQERRVPAFDVIEIHDAFEVYLSQGYKEKVTIVTDENLLEIVVTEVKDNILVISNKQKIIRSKSTKLYITFKELNKIDILGAVTLKGDSKFKFDVLKLMVSGAATINLDLVANKLVSDLSGGTEIKLSGNVSIVNMNISGAANLSALNLITDNFKIYISGAGNAKINVNKQLDVSISGAGNVKYKGNPLIKKNISGVGTIQKL